MEIVRKKLDPNEVFPVNQRYNADTDTVQTTPDGGTTWVDTPQADPRTAPANQKPPPVADDVRCKAAANMVAFLKKIISSALGVISASGDAISLLTVFLGVFAELGPFDILFSLILTLATLLISTGADALEAAFTDAIYLQLQCILYCNIGVDGTVTQAQLTTIQGAIADDIGGVVSAIFNAMISITGNVGLTNAGTLGDAPADCSSCDDCPYAIAITGDNLKNQFPAVNAGGAPTYAQGWWDESNTWWQAGIGTGGRAAWWQEATFTVPVGSTVTGFAMYYNRDGINTDSVIKGLYATVNGTVVLNVSGTTTVPNPWGGAGLFSAVAGDEVILVPNLNANYGATELGLYRVDLFGTGVPALLGDPF